MPGHISGAGLKVLDKDSLMFHFRSNIYLSVNIYRPFSNKKTRYVNG